MPFRPPIEIHRDDDYELPDPDELAHTQHLAAIDRLNEDKSIYPRFHELTSVHEMTGSFAPEELLVVAGDVGNGKSLLCQNLFDDQIGTKCRRSTSAPSRVPKCSRSSTPASAAA
jgi:hypothetical protein